MHRLAEGAPARVLERVADERRARAASRAVSTREARGLLAVVVVVVDAVVGCFDARRGDALRRACALGLGAFGGLAASKLLEARTTPAWLRASATRRGERARPSTAREKSLPVRRPWITSAARTRVLAPPASPLGRR